MASKHDRTLAAIFTNPTPGNVKWRDVEALLLKLGARKSEGDGSRVRFVLNNEPLNLHRPHPSPEMKRYAVRKVAMFLERMDIRP